MSESATIRRRNEGLDRAALEEGQLVRLNVLLARILPENQFYARKLAGIQLPLRSLDDFRQLPLTTKEELVVDGTAHAAPANLTWPLERYVRFHQTSGTHGRPMAVYDSAEDWKWWIDCWQYVLDAAEVTAADRAMLAFSFGPFIGFWTAHDALVERGALVIPGGGMNSRARLDLIERTEATALFCTPTYALHLVEVAEQCNVNLARCSIEKIVVAGEPGGSIPSVRERIESAWGARVIDHAGASEVGPWGYATADRRGVHVLESEFIAEFVDFGLRTSDFGFGNEDGGSPQSAIRNPQSEIRELVLTSLGRPGLPVIRYRTGDLVRPRWSSNGPNKFVVLEGGVLGRADDMLIIRGVNVFPTAVEEILRSFPEVVEYRMTARKNGAMDELVVEVEDHLERPARIADELYVRLGLRIDVRPAAPLSLPRFEGKGRRFVDER